MDTAYRYRLLAVFTKSAREGNPLAVFPSADGFSVDLMQRIAADLDLSETVFLVRTDDPRAVARARIFTPQRELDFAGHPTIGSAFVLFYERSLPETFAIEENVGLVPIEVDADERGDTRFWLTTPQIEFFETLEPETVATLLDIPLEDLEPTAPPRFVSAGSPLLFVCLRSPAAVDRATLRQEHLPDAIGSEGSVGAFVFARKEPASATCFDVYSRMFAPQTGIPEDPATGGATGPLAAYMLRYGLLPPRDGVAFTSEQGTKMGRKSFLHVRVGVHCDRTTIRVGGSAVLVREETWPAR